METGKEMSHTQQALRFVNGKMYAVCDGCGNIVRCDKLLFGDLHFCTTPEERELHKEEIQIKAAYNRDQLMRA